MTRNNFLKDTRKYNFYMKRNLRFWQFPFGPPNLAIFESLLNFYYIFVNMHHLATSMPKISFPPPPPLFSVKNWNVAAGAVKLTNFDFHFFLCFDIAVLRISPATHVSSINPSK